MLVTNLLVLFLRTSYDTSTSNGGWNNGLGVAETPSNIFLQGVGISAGGYNSFRKENGAWIAAASPTWLQKNSVNYALEGVLDAWRAGVRLDSVEENQRIITASKKLRMATKWGKLNSAMSHLENLVSWPSS